MIKKILSKLFNTASGKSNPDEMLVKLIHLAKNDDTLRERLIPLLSQDKLKRKTLIKSWITAMELNNESSEFTSMLRYLADDEIASKALQVLQESN
ncbi:MAG: hypothetical protein ABIA63_05775 [bacterium]